jgi:hypothetical protein
VIEDLKALNARDESLWPTTAAKKKAGASVMESSRDECKWVTVKLQIFPGFKSAF